MDLIYWYYLNCVRNINDREKYLLVKEFGGAKEVLEKSFYEIAETNIINYSRAKKLLNNDFDIKGFKKLEQQDIKICTLINENYPSLLKEIYDPPIVLFYRGSLPQNNCFSIVGSRNSSIQGEIAAKNLATLIAEKDIWIVSGMAKGIDSAAHRGALQTGKTAAVLGCGINICYPSQNDKLMKLIEKSGCVMSEFHPDEKPTRYSFPRRNRIISGLSEAVVVVEAGVKSGALITVDFAIEQGREVYAVDWGQSTFSPGTKKIIEEGATRISPLI